MGDEPEDINPVITGVLPLFLCYDDDDDDDDDEQMKILNYVVAKNMIVFWEKCLIIKIIMI